MFESISLVAVLVAMIGIVLYAIRILQETLHKGIQETRLHVKEALADHAHELGKRVETLANTTDNRLKETNQHVKESLMHYASELGKRVENLANTTDIRLKETNQHVKESLTHYAQELGKRVESLTNTTDVRLKEINQHVEKRLSEGFEKTTATFSDIVKRLALIDAAQKQITELSNNVVSLQEVLNDKRSRGAFGEIQLSALIRNVIPEQHFSFQHAFSNGKRADCVLFLPEPTGHIAIDAKFPLESFRIFIDHARPESERRQAEQQFKIDIRKHIQDIADKYIIPGETADGAMMFIPAEAIFAEIHAHHADLVEFAQRAKVWIVSPTTMMAILTTARAVLKDAATRQQMHVIQKHLHLLADDFSRFQKRMDNLARHIEQAHTDVSEVNTSAKKISHRFEQIEQVELASIIEESLTEADDIVSVEDTQHEKTDEF